MVYRGPSKGCKTCRTRRVRCDQKRPGCGNCAKQKHICPGYNDLFLHRHRDETTKITKCYRRRGEKIKAGRCSESSAVTFPNIPATESVSSTAALDSFSVPSSRFTTLILSSFLPDVQHVALNFFFLCYGSSHTTDATGCIFHLLPAMYATCAASSPLALATAALAVNVTSLWRLQGSDTPPARQLYAQAVTGVKEVIADATRNRSDELLMAALVLEFYDSINGEYQCNPSPGVHAAGSLALLKHRAILNYRNQLSQHLVMAIRHKYVQEAITGRQVAKSIGDIWQIHDPMPQSPAARLDRLAFDLFTLKDSLRLPSNQPSRRSLKDGGINRFWAISRALALQKHCTQWIDSLPDRWRLVPVNRGDVNDSIKRAGMWGTTCHVYANLSIASVRNWHRLIELGILQILRTYPYTLTERVCDGVRSTEINNVALRVQLLVDEICSSVPYCAGDLVQPASPVLGDVVHFPLVHMPLPGASAPNTFPESITQHELQVASSGARLMQRTLMSTVEMVEGGNREAYATLLCNGQLWWMKSQISRFDSVLYPRASREDGLRSASAIEATLSST